VGKSKQPDESIEMDEETKNRMINVYEYSRLNQARSIRQELNCSLLSILALLLLFSAVVYLAVFALKFIIVMATLFRSRPSFTETCSTATYPKCTSTDGHSPTNAANAPRDMSMRPPN
jgi:hypothetical protein